VSITDVYKLLVLLCAR